MNNFEVFLYFICFAVIAGGAFALMWGNIKSINDDMARKLESGPKEYGPSHFTQGYGWLGKKHPEAPEEGEEVMYVDLNRERLEKLYDDD